MHTTELVTQHEEYLRCNVCQWRCQIKPGDIGQCLIRQNQDGTLVVLSDELISAATIGPIEDYGFRHFFPDSMVLAIGSWGTPFPTHQDESHHAIISDDPKRQRRLSSERLVQFAQQQLVRGIVWAYNDPVVNHEALLESMRLARAGSRVTGVVTGGFWSKAALDQLGPYLDGINLMLYGFSDESYHRLTGISQWKGILAGIEHAVKAWDCHLEITTPIATGINDSIEEIHQISNWIKNNLSPDTPWRIIPMHDSDTNAAVHGRELAKATGLHFIYGSDHTENTVCPQCGWVVIQRSNNQARSIGVDNGRCDNCRRELHIKTSVFKKKRRDP